MKEFFDMAAYAAYVWPSYGLTLIVVVIEYLLGATAALEIARRGTPAPGDACRGGGET